MHAIRWYEAQGLIPMDRLRRTGMSIADMRRYTQLVKQGQATLRERRRFLEAHRARVEATISEWSSALRLIDEKIDFYGEWLSTGRRPGAVPGSSGR